MREYLTKIKTLCDQLATASHKLFDLEKMLPILSGLDDEYEAVVAVVSSKERTPSIEYVHSILLSHEGRIEENKPVINEFSANYASKNQEKWYDNENQRGDHPTDPEAEVADGIKTTGWDAKLVKNMVTVQTNVF